jgi:hypothetical protein
MSSRLSVAKNVLKQGALAGDEVPLKVALEEDLFAASLAAGRVAVVLIAREGGGEACDRMTLEGTDAVRVVRFPTASATRFDLAVRFALLEGEEPVLHSPSFMLGRPATEEELARALAELEQEAAHGAQGRRSPAAPPSPSATHLATSSSWGADSPRSDSPRSGWVAARGPTAAVFSNPSSPRSPRALSPRVRSQSSATSPPAVRPQSGSIPAFSTLGGVPKTPKSILRTRKAPQAFQVGQSALAMCHLDDEVRRFARFVLV